MTRPTLVLGSPDPAARAALARAAGVLVPPAAAAHRVETPAGSTWADLTHHLRQLRGDEARDTMAVVDIGPGGGQLREQVSRLVLGFPEVYFVFISPADEVIDQPPAAGWRAELPAADADDLARCIREHHFVPPAELGRLVGLVERHARGFRPLFDPTGLRAVLKLLLQAELAPGRGRAFVPVVASRLGRVAAAADEEHPFAYQTGYAAYRTGHRVWLLLTEHEFCRVLPAQLDNRPAGAGRLEVVLSDWDLAYPDLDQSVPADAVGTELLRNAALAPGEQLLLVSGVRVPSQDPVLAAHDGRRVDKPNCGLFDLQASDPPAGNRLAVAGRAVAARVAAGAAARRAAGVGAAGPADRHAAPYRLAMIATFLLERLPQIAGPGERAAAPWIHAAVLAGEAKELLAGMSRATTYEAIAAQADAEAASEVIMFGASVRSHEVQKRLDLVEQEVAAATAETSQGAEPSATRKIELTALLRLCGLLRARYTSSDQVAAAEECLVAIGRYQQRLGGVDDGEAGDPGPTADWVLSPADGAGAVPDPGAVVVLGRFAGRYLDAVTHYGTSLSRLTVTSAGVALAFAAAFAVYFGVWAAGSTESHASLSAGNAVYHSVGVFLLQPGLSGIESDAAPPIRDMRESVGYRVLMVAELGIAYVHLGLLITMLHRRITKRAP